MYENLSGICIDFYTESRNIVNEIDLNVMRYKLQYLRENEETPTKDEVKQKKENFIIRGFKKLKSWFVNTIKRIKESIKSFFRSFKKSDKNKKSNSELKSDEQKLQSKVDDTAKQGLSDINNAAKNPTQPALERITETLSRRIDTVNGFVDIYIKRDSPGSKKDLEILDKMMKANNTSILIDSPEEFRGSGDLYSGYRIHDPKLAKDLADYRDNPPKHDTDSLIIDTLLTTSDINNREDWIVKNLKKK